MGDTAPATQSRRSLPADVARVWGPVGLAAPALAFPTAVPWVSLVSLTLATLWFVAAEVSSRTRPRAVAGSPLTPALVALFALGLVGASQSDYPALALPKLAGLALGLMTLRALLLTATSARRIWHLGLLYLAAGLVILLIAVLSVSESEWKWWAMPALYRVSAGIPQLFHLPTGQNGVNVNALGGTTLFFLPVLVALVCRRPAPGERAQAVLLGSTTLVVVAILLITQSRSAWLGSVVALVAMFAIRSRAVAITGAAAVVLVTGTIGWAGWEAVRARLPQYTNPDAPQYQTNDGRIDIWVTAVDTIREHPWTGIGLGAFREVVKSTGRLPAESLVPHAHNTFLQVALDTGVPGLVAYLAILMLATFMMGQIVRHGADRRLTSLSVGVWGALVGIHVFGITDAIALGAKVGIFFWYGLALLAATYNLVIADVLRMHHAPSPAADRPVSP